MEVKIAYFSAEFGIHESLPIYSGGLGVLAGDYIKSANELQLPLVGVGILYRKGYFQQRIGADGRQEARYPDLNPTQLPIRPVEDEAGGPLLVEVPIESRIVYLRVWVAEVGTIPVYLLDADHEQNSPDDRRLTDRLYGGQQEERICHEIILGIGGVRALRAMGVAPLVWHLNEGHPAFCVLERIREYRAAGRTFPTALEAVKSTTIFTTHTPVPAGHDVFPFALMDRYFGQFYGQLGTTREVILGLGRVGEHFNLTRLAWSTACKVNAVSKIHAEVTKGLLHNWTPLIPAADIVVESITNGVHTGTWLAPEFHPLFDAYFEEDWRHQVANNRIWQRIEEIPNEELWQAHQEAKQRALEALHLPVDAGCLVIGFARRFATYKRATLVLQDLSRFERIVNNPKRPVCMVFAGKAHPNDQPGQDLIQRIVHLSRTAPFQNRVFFLENYDLAIARHLVQGTDVWLNTPSKPMEASGTSGQKAGLNGVLNVSILDGWWPEGFNGRNGWAIEDVDDLYQVLETEVVPSYYARNPAGLSDSWLSMMKEAMKSIGPAFSAHRMALEYWNKLYNPVAQRGTKFLARDLEVANRVADFKEFMRSRWHKVEIEAVQLEAGHHWMDMEATTGGWLPQGLQGPVTRVLATVQLGDIWDHDICVQAVGSDGRGGVWRINLELEQTLGGGRYLYQGGYAGSPVQWQQEHANIRVFPVSADFTHDFELELVTWGESPY